MKTIDRLLAKVGLQRIALPAERIREIHVTGAGLRALQPELFASADGLMESADRFCRDMGWDKGEDK